MTDISCKHGKYNKKVFIFGDPIPPCTCVKSVYNSTHSN